MKQYWIAVGAGALLAGCVSPYGWSEAPLDGGYAGSYPVGWWGRDAGSVDDFYGPLSGYGQWVVFGNLIGDHRHPCQIHTATGSG